MTAQVNTGMLIALVAGVPATEDAAGYAALTYINVGEVTSIGAYGSTTDVITHMPLATGRVEKFKGFTNNGSIAMDMARDAADLGQIALSSGADGANKNAQHSFKVTYPSGDIDYFQARIFGYSKNPGGANSIVSASTSVEVNSDIVEVAAP